jgi:hypothetical protein
MEALYGRTDRTPKGTGLLSALTCLISPVAATSSAL